MAPRKTRRESNPNRPDFVLKIKVKDEMARDADTKEMVVTKKGRTAAIGAAWWHNQGGPDERISIRLNPGVVLNWHDDEDCMITLWRYDE